MSYGRFQRVVALVCLAVSSQACTSWTTLRPAKASGQGITEVVLAPEVVGVPGAGALPSLEVYVRHGFTDIFDVGFKLFPVGLGVDFNVELLSNSHFALSLDPAVTGTYFSASTSTQDQNGKTVSDSTSAFIGSVWLPVLLDVLRTEHVIMTLGPKVGYLFVTSKSSADANGHTDSLNGVAFGGSVAFRFQATPGFAITPEFAAITTTDALNSGRGAGALLYNANIGFGF